MKRALCIGLMLLPGLAECADWRDQLTPAQPGNFPLPKPMTATYRFGWGAFTAATADISFTREKGEQLQLAAKGQTSGFVRTLWPLDFTHNSRVSATTLLPVRMRQTEIYSWENRRTEVDYTPEKVVRLRETKPTDTGTPRKKTLAFPNLRDLHAALLFARSQPLQPGDAVGMAVYPSTDAYFASVKVLGRERVRVAAGKFNALKLELKLWEINQTQELEPHPKFKRATAWLSDDADRLFLKVEAEIFVGNVWAELASVKR